MHSRIANLEPPALWSHFVGLNAVPRPSKQEEQVIQFVQNFGHQLGLEVQTDPTGNVLIRKPATPGKEERPVVALQSHLDMVHQKNAGSQFDFARAGIRMLLEGDWVRADGTTLGADNGIGVAAIMALLAATDIPHPALEALFTVDEETGMTGAKGLPGGLLHASVLLNLDTEDDNELTIGCAGGVDVQAHCRYASVSAPPDHEFLQVSLAGLTGGHSGTDIHLGRANANKLMNRFLHASCARFSARLVAIDGGGLRNVIPRESQALLAIPGGQGAAFKAFLEHEAALYKSEYAATDPDLQLTCAPAAASPNVLDGEFQARLLQTVYAVANGIYRMSPDVEGLVQTSNNLARVLVREGELTVQCLSRSSVDSEKMDLATAIRCPLEMLGTEVSVDGAYSGWLPRPESGIVTLMTSLYRELYGEMPRVTACHAGLECGILGKNYPDMEMISLGPNIRGAHSPDEKVQVSSVQKFWQFLTTTLDRI